MTGFGKQMSRLGRGLLAAIAFGTLSGALTGAAAAENPSAPSLKPVATRQSPWMETGEFTLLTRALDYADDGRWTEVRSALDRLKDPGAQALLRWRLATDSGYAMGFSELTKALEEFMGWPDYENLVSQAELVIRRSSLTSDERIAWLKTSGPRTGEGILALADAYNSAGKTEDMKQTIRSAYRTRAMNNTVASDMQSIYGGELSSEDHWARADMFLWRSDIRSAQALLPKMSAGRKKLTEARIGLMQNKKGVDKLVDAVPDEYRNDPGLVFDRARWNERRGRDSTELDMLLKITGSSAPEVGRERIWEEKQTVMRRLIRERDFRTAYTLAADHGLLPGEAFRDAEWTAGWIALQKLNDAPKAEAHFRTFLAGVVTPISVARGQYWLGEVLTAQQKIPEAQTAYEAAAKFPYVFYGQLAAEKIKSILY